MISKCLSSHLSQKNDTFELQTASTRLTLVSSVCSKPLFEMSNSCHLNNNNDEEHDNFYHYEDGNYECKKPNCSVTKFRYPDGSLKLRNPNIEKMDQDVLYHLALGSGSHDLVKMFGDIKFVCMGGTSKRMESFAYYIMKEIGYELPPGTTLVDISQYSYRFGMFKVGPVLAVSHGMGVPSVSILLSEIIKLMYHAKVKDPIFFRIGTCGGIGLEPGSVVVSDDAIDEMGNHYYQVPVLGKYLKRPAKFDQKLVGELISLSKPDDPFKTVKGTTMCANDFYEGQGRTDGAFCEHTDADKIEYLKHLQSIGVKNIEMESVAFAALTHYAGIKAADVCVTFLDRLKGDQVATPKDVLNDWQKRPQILVGRYIKKYLKERH